MKPITKSNLKNIKVEQTKDGFVVWVEDKKQTPKRYWIIDASEIKIDGQLRLGCKSLDYKIQAHFNESTNLIEIFQK